METLIEYTDYIQNFLIVVLGIMAIIHGFAINALLDIVKTLSEKLLNKD